MGDTLKFQIANGVNGFKNHTDHRYFTVDGTKLIILNEIDLGTKAEQDYTVNVEAVDSGGLKCDITVTVHVMDVNEPFEITNLPRVVQLNALTGLEGDKVIKTSIQRLKCACRS